MRAEMDLREAVAGFQEREAIAKRKEMIKNKYQGRIDDKLLNQILIDDNPQRIAEVLATIDEALIMQGKGMGPDQVIQTIKESWKRKPQATGGRVPLFGGGAAKKLWQEFIEKQFLKASNDIRQGKGLFKGLTQDQWITQHGNLTKKLMEWKMGGKKALPPGMKEYFGMNDIQLANKFKQSQTQAKVIQPHGLDEKALTKKLLDEVDESMTRQALHQWKPKGKPHASGGRVSLSSGGLAGMLGE